VRTSAGALQLDLALMVNDLVHKQGELGRKRSQAESHRDTNMQELHRAFHAASDAEIALEKRRMDTQEQSVLIAARIDSRIETLDRLREEKSAGTNPAVISAIDNLVAAYDSDTKELKEQLQALNNPEKELLDTISKWNKDVDAARKRLVFWQDNVRDLEEEEQGLEEQIMFYNKIKSEVMKVSG
jgi:chromosome segregation ATPase